MHCLYCGKPLGFLKELTDGEFCSSQHRQRYKKLTKLALARLLEMPTASADNGSTVPPEMGPGAVPRSGSFPGREVGKARNLGGLFRQDLRAKLIPAQPEPTRETLPEAPVPSLPGFSHTRLRPALGNANAVWSRLEPAPPTQPALINTFNEPNGIPLAKPRTRILSGTLRQEGIPTLRKALFSPPSTVAPLPRPSSCSRDDRSINPILEFGPVLAMPRLPRIAADASLFLAQSVPAEFAVQARSPALVRPEAQPLAFQPEVQWRRSARWSLSTLGFPVFAVKDLAATQLCMRIYAAAPRAQAALHQCRPISDASWEPVTIRPATASLSHSLALGFSLPQAGFQTSLPLARDGVSMMAAASAPMLAAIRPVLPQLKVQSSAGLPYAESLATRLREAVRASASASKLILSELRPPRLAPGPAVQWSETAGQAALPVAGLAPVARVAPALSKGLAMQKVEAIPLAVHAPRLPVSQSLIASQALRAKGAVKPTIQVLNTSAKPISAPGDHVEAASSVLPALASLFRYARSGKTPKTSSVVFEFEGLKPKNPASVPLAFMELPMPRRAPLRRSTSTLRIVETFEYLRPLDRPPTNPFEALVRLWRNTPAFLRFAAAGVCTLVLLWAAIPEGRITEMAASRWGEFQRSVQSRAAVELTEDFGGGMDDWEGQGRWIRTWSYDRAGFARPGSLALYGPSMRMEDYRVEFLAQIERKSVSWVYRASDQANYYASKITIVKPGPVPSIALIRYPVINGKLGPRVEVPIRVLLHNDTPYRVQVSVNGQNFSTSIEGQIVDYWRDDRLKVGGVGFFSDSGERARLYWVKLSHQDDFIGRVCAYFYPNPIQIRSGN